MLIILGYNIYIKVKFTSKVNKNSLNNTIYKEFKRIYNNISSFISSTYNKYKYYIIFPNKKNYLLRYKDKVLKAFNTYRVKINNNNKWTKIKKLYINNKE